MANRYLAVQQEIAELEDEASKLLASETGFTPEQAKRSKDLRSELELKREELAAHEVRRAAELRQPPVAVVSSMHDNEADRPWATVDDPEVRHYASKRHIALEGARLELGFGRMMEAVRAAGNRLAPVVDPRLMKAAASGGNTTVGSDGGFLVEEDYSTMLLDRVQETAKVSPLCNPVPISNDSDTLEMPYIDETSRATGSRWGGVQVYRRAEADTVTATKPKFGEWRLQLEDIMGIAYMTGRQLADASSTGAIYSKAFASEMAFKIDDEIIRGDGNGACLGLLQAPALVSTAKETGQPAATLLQANLSKMWLNLDIRSQSNAVWLINQEIEAQLDALYTPTGTAGIDARFVTWGPDGVQRIKGRPVITIEQCEALGTVGDIFLVDLSEYILISKGGIQADQSMHVRFLYDEQTFRWILRMNGAPSRKAAVTVYKGTSSRTVSPYVALATRA